MRAKRPRPETPSRIWERRSGRQLSARRSFCRHTGGPLSIDERTYEQHAQKIREQFGIEVDCPELTYLASRRARFEHVIALQHIAPKFAELLERQRTERANLLRNAFPGCRGATPRLLPS